MAEAEGSPAKGWREWAHVHVRPRDLLAFAALPAAFVIGVVAAGVPAGDAVRATGITASIGAITTIVGYYFGRGEATTLAREAAQARSLWVRAQSDALRSAAEVEKLVALVGQRLGIEPHVGGDDADDGRGEQGARPGRSRDDDRLK